MSVIEWGAAALFALLGVRSLVHWLAHPVISDSPRDRVLFALFVVCRAGLWFALAGLFLLYASLHTQGRAFVDEAAELRWYFFVLAIPAVGQFLTGFFLGRPSHDPFEDRDA